MAIPASRLDRGLIGAALLIAVLGFLSPDKIRVGDGFGWDGALYGAWAKDFRFLVIERKVDDYYVSKILPAGVIHYAMRLGRIPLTDRNIISAFGVFNAALICAGAYVWLRIARQLKLTGEGTALGFIGLFLNYAVIKAPSYYPVLNDTAGWFGGLLLVTLYLEARPWLIILSLPFLAFTWPVLLVEGALLLAFPKSQAAVESQEPPSIPWHGILAGLLSGVLIVGTLTYLRQDNRPVTAMICLGAIICGAYAFVTLGELWKWDQLFRPQFWLRFRVQVVLALVAVMAVKAVVHTQIGAVSKYTFRAFLHQIAWTSTMHPGVFFVSHIVYFGPLLLVALFRWTDVCLMIRKLGVGFSAVASLALLLGIDSESRHVVSLLPFFVVPIVCVADRSPWRWTHVALFGLLSLVFAKPWLIIGDNLRLYFLSQGPYMSVSEYRSQLTAVAVLAVVTYWMLKRSRRAAPRKSTAALPGLLCLVLAGCSGQPVASRPVSKYGSYLLVVTPRETVEKTPFNRQPDGGSAFSVTGKGFDQHAVITANGQRLRTAFANNGWLTSEMPSALYEKPGVVVIKVVNSNGKESNSFDFKVTPAK